MLRASDLQVVSFDCVDKMKRGGKAPKDYSRPVCRFKPITQNGDPVPLEAEELTGR